MISASYKRYRLINSSWEYQNASARYKSPGGISLVDASYTIYNKYGTVFFAIPEETDNTGDDTGGYSGDTDTTGDSGSSRDDDSWFNSLTEGYFENKFTSLKEKFGEKLPFFQFVEQINSFKNLQAEEVQPFKFRILDQDISFNIMDSFNEYKSHMFFIIRAVAYINLLIINAHQIKKLIKS